VENHLRLVQHKYIQADNIRNATPSGAIQIFYLIYLKVGGAMARASGVDDVTVSCRPYIVARVDVPVVAIFSVTEVSLLREGYC